MDKQQASTQSNPANSGPMNQNPELRKVGETARETVDTVQQTAGHAIAQVRDQGKNQLNDQKDQVAGSIDTVAHAMRRTGWHLREENQNNVAQVVDQAATQLERFSSNIKDKDVEELVWEAEHFARRQPSIFLGGAFFLGMLAARFLKSGRPAPERGGYGNASSYARGAGVGYGAGYPGGAATGYGSSRSSGGSEFAASGSMASGTATASRPHPYPPQADIYDQVRGEAAPRNPARS